MKLNEKTKFGIVGVLIILFVSIIFIIKNSNKENQFIGELNVLNWTSYIPEEIIQDFEKEEKIKVNYGTYSSNEELLAKVSSAAPGTYDLVFPSDYMVELMSAQSLLEPLDLEKLPNKQNLNPLFLSQEYDPDNKFSLPFLLATTVLIYDSSKLDSLTSYRDLLKPELKNNVVLLDDQRVMIGAFLNAEGFDSSDFDDAHLEKAQNFYKKLKPNVKAFDSDSPKTFFITKEVDAGIIWNAEALLAKQENENLKIVYPAEGFTLSMDNYVILKNAKNRDSAYKFINYLLRDEVSKRIVEEYPYISPNKSAENLSPDELYEILKNGSYIKNVGENIKKFDTFWANIK